jgi:hypothetical protein
MKNILKVITWITVYLASILSLCAAESIQNVHSTSHELNGVVTETEIAMSWDSYTTVSVYYFYTFNTSENYSITSIDDQTNLTSIKSEDFEEAVKLSTNSSIAYYFHIAARTGNPMTGWSWSTTTHKGPYYIDIKPPSHVNVSGPETTSTQVVTLSLYADDNPIEMNISNSNFGEGTWEPYATSTQFELKPEYGSQIVFVLFRDALGNTTDGSSPNAKTTINYISNTAPQIQDFLVGEAKIITGAVLPEKYTPVAPQVFFYLYDKEGGDIQVIVSSSNLAASTMEFTRTVAYPYTKVTITSTADNGRTTYTITDFIADMPQSFSLIIMPANYTSVSSTITLMVKDSSGLTDSVNIVFNVTENLLAKLSEFTVTQKNDHMLIQWQTSSEIDTAGFTLKRSESKNGIYKAIPGLFIPATGSSISGKNYTYQDSQIEIGKDYYYQLVEIDLNNNEKICSVSTEVKRSRQTDEDEINYDANGDGDVNVGDVIYLLQQLTFQ